MSGQGGSGWGGGGGGEALPTSCETLKFDAQLVSPQPAAVTTLKVGDALEVALKLTKGQTVVEVQNSGNTVGGLIGPDANRLRHCLEAGHAFNAKVLAVNGGQVRVRVEPA